MDRHEFVYRANVTYDEHARSHVVIKRPALCRECETRSGTPCLWFCPGRVYEKQPDTGGGIINVSHIQCLHDKACLVKCPFDNIDWQNPAGGEGPRYMGM